MVQGKDEGSREQRREKLRDGFDTPDMIIQKEKIAEINAVNTCSPSK
jgi:hypothetical protein